MSEAREAARKARIGVLKMIHKAQSSHIGSNFSCIDILTVLFRHIDLEKDEFICSKGWVAAAIYYFLAERGVIPKEDLKRYCMPGEGLYIGLVEPQGKFGLRAAGGAVGYGLSFGVGFALSKKLGNKTGNVYVLMSDGEMDTGMTYESMLVASHHRLDNLVAVIDKNGFQATGKPNEVLNIEPLRKKWEANGWFVIELDGHDHCDMQNTIEFLQLFNVGKPKVIIAHTIKGKGVSFMEDQLRWHYLNVDDGHYKKAMEELCI